VGLRHRNDYEQFRAALIEGYTQHRLPPSGDFAHLDDFIATRHVAFGLWFAGTAQANPAFRADLDQVLGTSAARWTPFSENETTALDAPESDSRGNRQCPDLYSRKFSAAPTSASARPLLSASLPRSLSWCVDYSSSCPTRRRCASSRSKLASQCCRDHSIQGR
jgi:Ser/Thr protein kinase RdoA (MazF antagonist)